MLQVLSMCLRCPFAAAMLLLTAGAGDAASSFDIVSIMKDAVDKVSGNIFAVLAIVVPAIALVVAAVVSVKFGIGWLKRLKN